MGEIFFKAMKWVLFVSFIIGGIAIIRQIERQGVEVSILAVFSFGAAYIMSGPWRKLPPKPMTLSVVLVALLALAAQYLPYYLYIYTGERITINFYWLWIILTAVIGAPVMMAVFKRYGAD